MYLTYKEYQRMDGVIEEQALFERYELRARKLIDRMTHGRIRDETPVRQAVQMAMFELIELGQQEDAELKANSGREIASMSNDGAGVSYAVGSGEFAAGMRWNARKCAVITEYLQGEITEAGVNLLYAGCDA